MTWLFPFFADGSVRLCSDLLLDCDWMVRCVCTATATCPHYYYHHSRGVTHKTHPVAALQVANGNFTGKPTDRQMREGHE